MQQLKDYVEKEILFHSSRHTLNAGNMEMKKGMVHSCRQIVRAIDNNFLPLEKDFLDHYVPLHR